MKSIWGVGCILLLSAACTAAVYSTWDAPELDKYACIWYIHHYLDPKAEFRFYPLGEEITAGIPFDVPLAKWRREGSRSTLDSIIEEQGRTDPALEHLRLLIREVEISPWARQPSEEATKLEMELRLLLEKSEQADKMQAVIAFFNAYLKIK